jgi:hypothetical protein
MLAAAAVVAALLTVVPSATVGADAPAIEPADSDPTALLEKYVPVIAMRERDEPCSEVGDPYRPLSVDEVLGRDDVVLRDATGAEVTRAPTVADLAAAGEDWALDFPGDALSPGCTYEQWEQTLGADPVLYGRVVLDRGKVIAQYWFFYTYNDWNDRHEGDWEMVQLVFDAPTVAEAMAKGPALYAYAQHEGSQYVMPEEIDGLDVSSTGDDVHLVGDSPVVFAAQGSHAAYFKRALFFGKSGQTGFGCDDTSSPVVQVHPSVVVLPTDPPTTGDLAWLSYPGRWGERQPLFNNGPTGPVSKDQWADPLGWVEAEGRATAVDIPFGGTSATDAFCDISRTASLWFIRLLDEPLQLVLLTIAVVVVAVVLIRYSSRGLFSAAVRSYREQPGRLLLIGGLFLVAALISYLLRLLLQLDALSDDSAFGEDIIWPAYVIAFVANFISIPVSAWVVGATIGLVSTTPDPARPRRASWLAWLPRVRWSTGLASLVLLFVAAVTLSLGAPLAILLSLFWLVTPVACAALAVGIRKGMKDSRRTLKGHRIRAAGVLVMVAAIVSLIGLSALIVLFVTNWGFGTASLILNIVSVVVVPFAALVVAHFYAQAKGEQPIPAVVDVPVDTTGAAVTG